MLCNAFRKRGAPTGRHRKSATRTAKSLGETVEADAGCASSRSELAEAWVLFDVLPNKTEGRSAAAIFIQRALRRRPAQRDRCVGPSLPAHDRGQPVNIVRRPRGEGGLASQRTIKGREAPPALLSSADEHDVLVAQAAGASGDRLPSPAHPTQQPAVVVKVALGAHLWGDRLAQAVLEAMHARAVPTPMDRNKPAPVLDPARQLICVAERALDSLRNAVRRCIARGCGPHYLCDDSDGFAHTRWDATGEP
jgi:hypothetical protein